MTTFSCNTTDKSNNLTVFVRLLYKLIHFLFGFCLMLYSKATLTIIVLIIDKHKLFKIALCVTAVWLTDRMR